MGGLPWRLYILSMLSERLRPCTWDLFVASFVQTLANAIEHAGGFPCAEVSIDFFIDPHEVLPSAHDARFDSRGAGVRGQDASGVHPLHAQLGDEVSPMQKLLVV